MAKKLVSDYEEAFCDVVLSPNFRVMGFSLRDLMILRRTLETWDMTIDDIREILAR